MDPRRILCVENTVVFRALEVFWRFRMPVGLATGFTYFYAAEFLLVFDRRFGNLRAVWAMLLVQRSLSGAWHSSV